MNRIVALCLLLIATLLSATPLYARNARDTLSVGGRMHFTENKGQWESNILFKSVMSNADLFMERNCFTILLSDPKNPKGKPYLNDKNTNKEYRFHAYRVNFVNAKADSIVGQDKEDTYENYFIGNDPKHWASEVHLFQTVEYHNIYPKTDLKVYSAEGALKYDFVLHPGASPKKICLSYDGTDGLRTQNGNLIIKTSVLDIVELEPYAYQIIDGKEVEVKCSYRLKGNAVTFDLGDYDASKPLVIDPMLIFSTYTGSVADNWGTTAAFDSHKNTYSAGLVFGNGYPTTLGAFQTTSAGNADIGVIKLDATGAQRVYATYIGGTYADMPHSLYVNEFDELVILGTTGSPNFPTTTSAYSRTFSGGSSVTYLGTGVINFPSGSDIFVCRLNATGTRLGASTYIGGTGNDGLNYKQRFSSSNDIVMLGNDSLYYNYGDGARGELITDDLNNVYVASCTFSSNFPTTPGSFQPTAGGAQDGVVFKLDYNLSNLLWSSYIGGSNDDAAYSIDTDDEYNILVCGGTNSNDYLVTANAYNMSYNGGSADAFIAKISSNGTQLMGSTFFGSPAYDQAYFVRTGKQNHVFVFGQTKASGNTLIHNAQYNVPNSGQFLARFGADLDTLIWSTVFGTGSGVPNISPTAFAADVCNRVYAAGWGRIFCGYYLAGQIQPWNTNGTWGMQVSPGAIQSSTDGQDFYVICITETANAMDYATFFGESHTGSNANSGHDHVDGGTSRFDKMATLYQSVCASCGGCQGFPTTPSALSSSNNSSNCNNGIFRMNVHNDFPVADFIRPPVGCFPDTVTFINTGFGTSFRWYFGDGGTSTAQNPTHIYTQPGIYNVMLVAYLENGCHSTDSIVKQIMILGHQQPFDTVQTCPGNQIRIGQNPQMGCTYHWISGNVSDSTIANPYTTVYNDTVLYCVVSNGACTDTIPQNIIMSPINMSLYRDTSDCTSPILISTITQSHGYYFYHFSSNRYFTDTLNPNTMRSPNAYVNITGPQYFYVKVYDTNGCFSIDSVFVNFVSIAMPVVFQDPLCPGSCDGFASVSLNNATPPFDIRWSTGNRTDTAIYNLCQGNYSIRVMDSKGCSVTQNFTLVDPQGPVVTKAVGHTNCAASCNGYILDTITGPSQYVFEWLDAPIYAPERHNLCIGTYILKITDSNGCEYFDTTQIVELPPYTDTALVKATCKDLCSGEIDVTPIGGVSPYTYSWSHGANTSFIDSLCSGTYSLVITDSVNCSITDTFFVDVYSVFDSMRVWADDTVVFRGNTTRLYVTPVQGATYHWDATSGSLGSPNSPTTTAGPNDSTWYYVTVIDSLGCEYRDSLFMPCIDVICGRPNVFIPNAFSPNGDGQNDQLCFKGEWIVSFHIAIFSRWGEKVFETNDINECWDGTYKGRKCQSGVYMYTCDIECEGHQNTYFKGDVTIIK